MTPERNHREWSDGVTGQSRGAVGLDMLPPAGFADIAGLDEAKAELRQLIEFRKDPSGATRLGAHMPKGVLLVGPPGTGKTLLARAVAGEAALPLCVVTGAGCVRLAESDGPGIRDLFDEARAKAPAVFFIDGLDALGGADRPIHDAAAAFRERALHQLLAAIDAVDPHSGIVLLGASNRPDLVDPALLRSGRFDRHILTERPGKAARSAILSVHLARVKAASEIDVERVAAQTPGLTGADLARLVNEAALLATRRGATEVGFIDLVEARERMQDGICGVVRVLNQQDRETLAYHAMGRALVAMSLPDPDPIRGISLIPQDATLSGAWQDLAALRFPMSRDKLQGQLAVLLAGRAAERLALGRVSTAGNDALQQATCLARAMITRYGMADDLPPVVFDYEPLKREAIFGRTSAQFMSSYSEATEQLIDRLVQERVKQALDQGCYILKKRREVLDAGARLLLEKETLTAETLRALVTENTAAAA